MELVYLLEHSPVFLYSLVFILGLMVGSFLNVVIYRLPIMLQREWKHDCCEFLEIDNTFDSFEGKFNLSLPRSTCPSCQHKITALENIPIISYLFLGGQCSACSQKISIRYPFVELLTGLMSLTCALQFGFGFQLLFSLILTWSLVSLSFIDFDHQLLPDNITLPVLWLGILCNYFNVFTNLESSVLGAVFGYLIFWAVFHIFKLLFRKEGMGQGDFKLLSMLGAWLGWQDLLLIVMLSSFLGAIIGISLILFTKHQRTKPIPFGPYIAIAGWVAMFWGDELNQLYLNWAKL